MFVVWMSVAHADDLETWVGAGASGGITAFTESGFDSADATTTQAEVDGMIGWGWGHVRADLDLHFYLPALGDEGGDVIAYPSIVDDTGIPIPEWLMVQFGREEHARLGIVNPNMGVEDWDPWINYAPSYSNNFVYVGAGRFLGADVGFSTDNGYDYFAFGGFDLDWQSWGGGVGVATLQDAYSTWSGIVIYPEFGVCPDGDTCFNAFAQLALELYPASALWLAIEAYPGVKDGSFYTSTQFVANIIPESIVNPYVRAEVLIDPDNVTFAPGHSVSVGGRSDLLDFIRVMVEGKAAFPTNGDADLGVVVTLAVHRPEPNAYSFTDPFGAAEAEAE